MAKNVNFNMVAAASLDFFSDMSCEGKSCKGTLFSVSVSNLVRIRSKMAELLPFN